MEKKTTIDIGSLKMLALGRSGSGKTTTVCKYVAQLVKTGQITADRIVIFSPTFATDPQQQQLIKLLSTTVKHSEPLHEEVKQMQKSGIRRSKNEEKKKPKTPQELYQETNCYSTIDETVLQAIYDSQKQMKHDHPDKLKPFLLIFDDMISSSLIKRQASNPLFKDLFCLGRHWSIGTIFMLQRFKSNLDPTCRDQFNLIAMFRLAGKSGVQELLQDFDESPGDNAKETAKQLWHQYTDAISQENGHGCLVIHLEKRHGQGRLEQGLNTKIFID